MNEIRFVRLILVGLSIAFDGNFLLIPNLPWSLPLDHFTNDCGGRCFVSIHRLLAGATAQPSLSIVNRSRQTGIRRAVGV